MTRAKVRGAATIVLQAIVAGMIRASLASRQAAQDELNRRLP